MTKEVAKKKAVQSESLTKLPDGSFKLVVENYGDVNKQQLTQFFTAAELKEQYENLRVQHHNNIEQANKLKKQVMTFEGDELAKLKEFGDMLNKMKKFNEHIQAEAQIEQILSQQDAMRKGMKQISLKIPELMRKK